MKFYTLDNQFIEETNIFPDNFTGIVEYRNKNKEYLKNGRLHRENGASFISHNGYEEYWLNGNFITDYINCNDEKFNLLVHLMKLKGLL